MLTSNPNGNMQKHGYLGCFHAASTRKNISWVWVIVIPSTPVLVFEWLLSFLSNRLPRSTFEILITIKLRMVSISFCPKCVHSYMFLWYFAGSSITLGLEMPKKFRENNSWTPQPSAHSLAASKPSLSLKEPDALLNSISNLEDSTLRKVTQQFSTSTGWLEVLS